MANLFLDGIFSNNSTSPSSVRIYMPNPTDASLIKVDLVGLMLGDPTFSAQNKWGTVINDVSNLADLSSLMGDSNMFSWVNASTMCWKGTSPLTMGFEFYLINYKRGLNLEANLKELVKLASLAASPNATDNSRYKVQVHGGYAVDVFGDNSSAFWTSKIENGAAGLKDLGLKDIGDNAKSSLTVTFGNKSSVRNLLVSKITVTESNVEVSDQTGNNRKPLYYRVNIQFTGARPLLTKDVDYMFNFAR